jgi:hypothetical protein
MKPEIVGAIPVPGTKRIYKSFRESRKIMNLLQIKKKKVSLIKQSLRVLMILIIHSVFLINIWAQNESGPKISINLTDATLKEVITELEKVSGYNFRYTDAISDDPRIFSFKFSDEPISFVMNYPGASSEVSATTI